MPNITPTEIVLFCAAALTLCIGPAMLAWSDARRRRRELKQPALPAFEAAAPVPPVTAAYESVPPREPATAGPMAVPESVLAELLDEPATTAAVELPEAVLEETALPVAAAEPEPITPAAAPEALQAEWPPAPPQPPEEVPGREAPGYPFQLLDLRQARLPDWPPQAIRNDAERYRVWREAERLAAQHDRAISTTPLAAPAQMQATALGAAETDGSKFWLRFLLFPILWPVAADQAVAEAVFEIDPAGGVVRSWVAPLKRP